ncbi:hypothetical protein KPG71_19200 [Roseovarius sp. PS-C2]|uniref:hypothetical protein n=1 Tax=Roseovarius sp. PS-C2 TaxID=2820814 RepID=UPI001C0BE4B2|nr:hypothetical protein [Roseovarius sp. PS-C2]MBU3262152.1 hypothetical protein [Roseovarius sp. PS-C2]
MSNCARLPSAFAKTVLVVVFLVAGLLGETVHRPLMPTAPGVEQLQQSLIQRAAVTAEKQARTQRPDQVAAVSGSGIDGIGVATSEPPLPPERLILLLAAPRAPPVFVPQFPQAHPSRAPPVDMISRRA